TVYFTVSADGQANLPVDYTFTGGDNGVHTFTNGVTLRTSGGQTDTATDTANGAITGGTSVSVSAAAASRFTLSAPASATAGAAFTVTVTAFDQFGNTAAGYRGTVRLAAPTDVQAVLPGNYAFSTGDGGAHTFTNGVTLKT